MIIIYHLDEKNSIPFGQLMFERGFNNVFLLTGGILRNKASRSSSRSTESWSKAPASQF